MPDLTNRAYWHCETAESWCQEVQGSDVVPYMVRWDAVSHQNQDMVQYDYSCTCKAYQYGGGKHCKHIRQVRSQRCGWMQSIDGGELDGGMCPRCGGPVAASNWAE